MRFKYYGRGGGGWWRAGARLAPLGRRATPPPQRDSRLGGQPVGRSHAPGERNIYIYIYISIYISIYTQRKAHTCNLPISPVFSHFYLALPVASTVRTCTTDASLRRPSPNEAELAPASSFPCATHRPLLFSLLCSRSMTTVISRIYRSHRVQAQVGEAALRMLVMPTAEHPTVDAGHDALVEPARSVSVSMHPFCPFFFCHGAQFCPVCRICHGAQFLPIRHTSMIFFSVSELVG